MFNAKYVIYFGATALATCLPIIITRYYKKNCENSFKRFVESYNVASAKIITITYENNNECKNHILENISCGPKCSNEYLKYFIKCFEDAKSSIKLCMYQITIRSVFDAIINAKERGVEVQIITDREIMFSSGSQIRFLIKNGIKVKSTASKTNMLHHKFGIFDPEIKEKGKLFFGSLNITMQALSTNFDVVIFSVCPRQTKRFNEEFDQLWSYLPSVSLEDFPFLNKKRNK